MFNKVTVLRAATFLGVLDAFSILLLVLFYRSGVDLVFLVNINFILILFMLGVGSIGIPLRTFYTNKYIFFTSILLLIAVVKLFIAAILNTELIDKFIFTHFYSIFLILFSFLFVERFALSDYILVLTNFRKYAFYYLIISCVSLLIYIYLYHTGKIAYFGMGSNLHYVFPFFIKNSFFLFALLLALIIASGKRAVLINIILQYAIYALYRYKERKGTLIIITLGLVITIFYFAFETETFYRFKGIFNVDFNDRYSTLIAFGGRYEEILSIFDFLKNHPFSLLFGASPGDSYHFVLNSSDYFGIQSNDYDEQRNVAHVSLFTLVFMHGVIFSTIICLYAIYYTIKYYKPTFELYLVFVGILISSFFGANLFRDPMSWIFIAFFIKFKRVALLPCSPDDKIIKRGLK